MTARDCCCLPTTAVFKGVSPDPKFKMPKTYLVQVEGDAAKNAMEALRRGVELKDGPTLPAEVELILDPQM